jgi:hypothetical protein
MLKRSQDCWDHSARLWSATQGRMAVTVARTMDLGIEHSRAVFSCCIVSCESCEFDPNWLHASRLARVRQINDRVAMSTASDVKL